MDTSIFDYNVIMPRAQAGLEAERSKIEPLGYVWFKVLASASGIAIACASETYSLTTALKAQFEILSNGTDLGQDMMGMRPGIIAALILGHVLLHDGGKHSDRPVHRWLRRFRALPLIGIIGGVSIFIFVATSASTGSDDGSGTPVGWALGAGCAGLFSTSFLASNYLMSKFLPALRSILAGRAQRAKVKNIASELQAVDDYRARIETCRRDIAAKEAPDALRLTAAAEAAGIVGQVAAEAHDLHASCEAIPEDRRPEDDVSGLPDTPLPALDKRQIYLKGLDVPFFFNLLKKKEA